jgi:cellobiose phosphorylase
MGPHGLPQIGHADWNDCLNLNCFSTTPGESFQTADDISDNDKAESVMIAGMFCLACEEMAGLFRQLNQPDRVKFYLSEAASMKHLIYKHGWDGEWFLRAYDAESKKIGSKENEGGRIFIESQGWCILGVEKGIKIILLNEHEIFDNIIPLDKMKDYNQVIVEM